MGLLGLAYLDLIYAECLEITLQFQRKKLQDHNRPIDMQYFGSELLGYYDFKAFQAFNQTFHLANILALCADYRFFFFRPTPLPSPTSTNGIIRNPSIIANWVTYQP